MRKEKVNRLLVIALMVSLVFSTVSFMYIVTDIEDETNFLDVAAQPDSLIESYKPADNLVNVPETKQSVIDSPNQWFLSESVKTEIEFNSQLFDYTSILTDVYPQGQPYTFTFTSPFNAYENDDYINYWIWEFETALTAIDGHGFFKLYCGGEGDLYYDVAGRVTDTGSSSIDTSFTTGSYSISSSYLDALGYLNLEFYITAIKTNVAVWLQCHTPSYTYTIFTVSNGGSLSNNIDYLSFRIDELQFLRDTTTNTVRSEQKYASSAIMINKKIIP
ncbi:MAG: hypothetical protein KAU62_13315, partial [Candidatus Heimdallarchaeota archaeon]|nr:hypothetical protein [Candidatus Heimdallarchaeota archaeon]MCK4612131.1 hypothetical protein [Candidatus Heimdallarchaeota archaeon]